MTHELIKCEFVCFDLNDFAQWICPVCQIQFQQGHKNFINLERMKTTVACNGMDRGK